MAGHTEERKRAVGAVRPISSVTNNNKETNVNLISTKGVLICPRDAEPGGKSSSVQGCYMKENFINFYNNKAYA